MEIMATMVVAMADTNLVVIPDMRVILVATASELLYGLSYLFYLLLSLVLDGAGAIIIRKISLPFFILQILKFMVKYSHLRGVCYEVTKYNNFR